jgi:hypothetical protein
MAFPGQRSLVTFLCAAFVAGSWSAAFAQSSGDAKPPEQQKAPEPRKSEKDHLAEVARAVSGPAGYPECVHLGELAITLMAKNDLDTAFRHMDLYDRFGCPGAHIQQSFRCLLLAGIPTSKDSAANLEGLVQTCWATPKGAPAAPAAASTPPSPPSPPAPSTAGNGAR